MADAAAVNPLVLLIGAFFVLILLRVNIGFALILASAYVLIDKAIVRFAAAYRR